MTNARDANRGPGRRDPVGLLDWFGLEEGIAEARGYLETLDGLVAEEPR